MRRDNSQRGLPPYAAQVGLSTRCHAADTCPLHLIGSMGAGATTHIDSKDGGGSLLVLGILSLVAGAATGLVGALFQLALLEAEALRGRFLAWGHGVPWLGAAVVILASAAITTFAAWLVRYFAPQASGSGIPHAEAVLDGRLAPAPFLLVPVKFVGGALAIGVGLALGREGPTVQMGASLSHLVGKAFRRNWPDCRTLLAAGAGAGLATAFNAPIAGAIFVLEELVRRFETRIAIAALGASSTAIMVSRLFLGRSPDFKVGPFDYPGFEVGPLFLLLGIIAGLLAIGYNRLLLAAISFADRFKDWPVEMKAAIIGAIVGVMAWFLPDWVGGGDAITQSSLNGRFALGVLPLIFVFRFGLGPISYAARTPGGLFAPILVLGAQLGLIFAGAVHYAFPGITVPADVFAVVALAAFFTGTVRSPVTGILLITEMTGSFTLLLPMLSACFTAMLVPTILRDPPIYDSLKEG